MDGTFTILKMKIDPRGSSVPALGLYTYMYMTIIVKQVGRVGIRAHAHLNPKEIDGLIVPPGKAYMC